MKPNKFYIILSLTLLLIPGVISAQVVKYVAYFPAPYLSHRNVTVKKAAYFAGIDEGSVTVNRMFTSNSINAEKDLQIDFKEDTKVDLIAGLVRPYIGYGVFLVEGQNPSDHSPLNRNLTITTPQYFQSLSQIDSDDELNVPGIWFGGIKTFDGANSNIPSGTKRLCWLPLRINGTFNYQYYLVAWPNNTCPSCTAGDILNCNF